MLFKVIKPSVQVSTFVKEYWIVENDSERPTLQKIIPDGYTEIIFHYADPYRINLHGKWELQSKKLLAGQIKKYFYLQNTGRSGMIGIKLMPAAIHQLFGVDMQQITDTVVPLNLLVLTKPHGLNQLTKPNLDEEVRIRIIESWLTKSVEKVSPVQMQKINYCINIIFENHGTLDVSRLALISGMSRRQLERNFQKMVGLSPKRFSRIVRFKYIFELMKNKNTSWIDIALDSGHFDQSHFIKNFKEFSGEEPSSYGFDEQNMANFFLKRTR